MQPDDASALVDIAEAARLIVSALAGKPFPEFERDGIARDAVLYRLLVMGEATKRLSMAFREAHPGVRWRAVAGLRDILVHRYDRVDASEIWNIATNDVPALLSYVEPLLPTPEG